MSFPSQLLFVFSGSTVDPYWGKSVSRKPKTRRSRPFEIKLCHCTWTVACSPDELHAVRSDSLWAGPFRSSRWCSNRPREPTERYYFWRGKMSFFNIKKQIVIWQSLTGGPFSGNARPLKSTFRWSANRRIPIGIRLPSPRNPARPKNRTLARRWATNGI